MHESVENSIERVKQELIGLAKDVERRQELFKVDLDQSYALTVAARDELVHTMAKMPKNPANTTARTLGQGEATLYAEIRDARKRSADDATALAHCKRRLKLLEEDAKHQLDAHEQALERAELADARNAEAIANWSRLLQLQVERDANGLHIRFLHSGKQFTMVQVGNKFRFYEIKPDGAKCEVQVKFDGCVPRMLLRLRSL